MKLNVGSGNRLQEGINVDILKVKGLSVKCDIHFLPFKNQTFKTIECHHVLEHLEDWIKGLKELKRVTNGKVIVHVPFGFHDKIHNYFLPHRKNGLGHKQFFSVKQLKKYGKVRLQLKSLRNIRYLDKETYRYGFLDFIPPFPTEIRLEVNVN